MSKIQRDVIRSGPNNGPDYRCHKNSRRQQPGTKKRPDGKTLAENGNLRYFIRRNRILQGGSEAREHVGKCVGPSMPCIHKDECSRKPDAMPFFECASKPEAVNVSSAGSGENHRSTWTTSPEKDTCLNSFTVCRKSPSPEKKMTILDATAAVDREWDKLKSLLTWDFKNVKPKSEVVRQAKKDGIPPHVASLMGLCIANTPSSRKSSLLSPPRPLPLLLWKASSEKYSSDTFGKRYRRGSVFMSTENHNHFLLR